MPKGLADRVRSVYGAIYPGQEHGALEWFRAELKERKGIDVARSTFHRWTLYGPPDEHVTAVEETIKELADAAERCVETLQKRITEAR